MADGIEPVSKFAETSEGGPAPGIGLAVTGGGYRAMLFHLGAFIRLFETGQLKTLDRVSSVSGGSITAAKIALEWNKLGTRDDFFHLVVDPVRRLAGVTIDIPAIGSGILFPGSIAERVAGFYRKFLYGDATLQDLPDAPRFVINATNVESGKLWRFSKPYMRDYAVGRIPKPNVSLAEAVTASSAFPPVLSPLVLDVGPSDFDHVEKDVDPKFLTDISLTDGGVYDNLGLETVWKRYQTVLVSDAGGKVAPDHSPATDWARHAKRVLDIIHEQVSSLRRRQVMVSLDQGDRSGAYWGIRTDIREYGLQDALDAPRERTLELAETPTRLKRLPSEHQERLINWGYAICDAALRSRYPPQSPPKPAFPYPAVGI